MTLRLFAHNRLALGGAVLVVLVVTAAAMGPVLSTQDPLAMDLGARLQAPSGEHALGTDQFGRDLLARILHGARISVQVGLVAVAIGLVLGLPLGTTAAYVGGMVDHLAMRIMDAVLAFPAILLALAIVAARSRHHQRDDRHRRPLRADLRAHARAAVLAEREKEYVMAARALGQPGFAILTREILPNCWRRC